MGEVRPILSLGQGGAEREELGGAVLRLHLERRELISHTGSQPSTRVRWSTWGSPSCGTDFDVVSATSHGRLGSLRRSQPCAIPIWCVTTSATTSGSARFFRPCATLATTSNTPSSS